MDKHGVRFPASVEVYTISKFVYLSAGPQIVPCAGGTDPKAARRAGEVKLLTLQKCQM